MQFSRTARARRLVAIAGTGALLSIGCRPDDVQAPDAVQAPNAEVQAPQGGPITAAAVPQTGLIAQWKLNETGGTVANEDVAGLDATVQGGALFVPGKIKNALEVNNGTDGLGSKYAQAPSTSATVNDVQEGTYSISAWFRPYSVPSGTGASQFYSIVTKSGQHMGLVYNSQQKFVARHYLAGPTLMIANSGTATYPINAWHHVVSVVDKAAGTLKLYVNGTLAGTQSFTPNAAAFEYGTTPFRIGISGTEWAADGIVDQVRVYNAALTEAEIQELASEVPAGSSNFRFPVGMTKGQQVELLGDPPTPDGHMSGQSWQTVKEILDAARAEGARVTLKVTGGNGAGGTFNLAAWKDAFDNVSHDTMNVNGYVADGTLIAHYAIDEPFTDFPNNMSSQILEDMCQYQKSKPGWSQVPCVVRDMNTRLAEKRPGGYQFVDAGWAAIADHQYVQQYNNNMQQYFEANLNAGEQVGLGLMYGFNLLNGGREVAGCAKPDNPTSHNCAMTPAEVREVADAIAAIGSNQGCGLIGWEIDPEVGSPQRNYFLRSDIQSALTYMKNTVGGLSPGVCD